MAYKNKEDKNAAQRRYHERNRDKQKAMMKKYYDNNKHKWPDYETVKAGQPAGTRRWYAIKSRYKLTKEQWEAIYDSQGRVCAICKIDSEKTAIDHDHSCCAGDRSCGSCVRSILCVPCNHALGFIRDNPAIAREMAVYLEHWAINDRSGKH
jgi:hypothetical protein